MAIENELNRAKAEAKKLRDEEKRIAEDEERVAADEARSGVSSRAKERYDAGVVSSHGSTAEQKASSSPPQKCRAIGMRAPAA